MKVEFSHFRTDLSRAHRDYDHPSCMSSRVRRLEGQGLLRKHRKKGLPDVKAAVCCVLYTDQGRVEGWSFCSQHDNFVTKIGRRIAYGRALKKLHALRVLYQETADV